MRRDRSESNPRDSDDQASRLAAYVAGVAAAVGTQEFDGVSLAEILWLSPFLPDRPLTGRDALASANPAPPSIDTKRPDLEPPRQNEPQPARPEQNRDDNDARGASQRSSISEQAMDLARQAYVSGGPESFDSGTGAAATGEQGSGLRFSSPAGRALSQAREFALALRPLKREGPDFARKRIDEEATAERWAEWSIVLRRLERHTAPPPVYEYGKRRLLAATLLIDVGPTMGLWREVGRELARMLRWQGAFHDVRIHSLDPSAAMPIVRPGPSFGMQQDAAARNDARQVAWGELVPPRPDRVVIVFTDGLGPAWRSGATLDLLGWLGRHTPVAIWHMLPSTLWYRSCFGEPRWLASCHEPFVPNDRLLLSPLQSVGMPFSPSSNPGRDNPSASATASTRVPIPVVGLDVASLGAWSRLVAGMGRADVPAVRVRVRSSTLQAAGLLESSGGIAPPMLDRQDTAAPESLAPEERMARFLERASPDAQTLAGLASHLPLTPDILRLVQSAYLPGSSPGILAEILMSPLVQPVDAAGEMWSFYAGVPGLLLATVGSSRTLDVLRHIGDRLSMPPETEKRFQAFIEMESGAEGQASKTVRGARRPDKRRIFALLGGVAMRRLGVLPPLAQTVVTTRSQVEKRDLQVFLYPLTYGKDRSESVVDALQNLRGVALLDKELATGEVFYAMILMSDLYVRILDAIELSHFKQYEYDSARKNNTSCLIYVRTQSKAPDDYESVLNAFKSELRSNEVIEEISADMDLPRRVARDVRQFQIRSMLSEQENERSRPLLPELNDVETEQVYLALSYLRHKGEDSSVMARFAEAYRQFQRDITGMTIRQLSYELLHAFFEHLDPGASIMLVLTPLVLRLVTPSHVTYESAFRQFSEEWQRFLAQAGWPDMPKLNDVARGRLGSIITSVFNSPDHLRMVVKRIDETLLRELEGQTTMNGLATDLIEECERRGRLGDLLRAIREQHPSSEISEELQRLGRDLGIEPDTGTLMWGVPSLPRNFVPRPDVQHRMIEYLLADATPAPSSLGIVCLRGPVGSGKTTITAAVVNDPQIKARFPDGILWATLGEKPDLQSILAGWLNALGEDTLADARFASQQLGNLLQNRAVLLVLDDVRTFEHVEPFMGAGARCRTLVLSPRANIMRIGGFEAETVGDYSLSMIAQDELYRMLETRLLAYSQAPSESPQQSRVPGRIQRVTLDLAAGLLYSGMSWSELFRYLDHEVGSMPGFVPGFGESEQQRRHRLVECVLSLSLDQLSPDEKNRFMMLGRFTVDQEITVTSAAELWQTDEGSAKASLDRFVVRGLLSKPSGWETEDGSYRINESISDAIPQFQIDMLDAVRKIGNLEAPPRTETPQVVNDAVLGPTLFDVAVIYGREDKSAVEQLLHRLGTNNVDTFPVEVDPPFWRDWVSDVKRLLELNNAVLLCLSEQTLAHIDRYHPDTLVDENLEALISSSPYAIIIGHLDPTIPPTMLFSPESVALYEAAGFDRLITLLRLRAQSLDNVLPIGSSETSDASTTPSAEEPSESVATEAESASKTVEQATAPPLRPLGVALIYEREDEVTVKQLEERIRANNVQTFTIDVEPPYWQDWSDYLSNILTVEDMALVCISRRSKVNIDKWNGINELDRNALSPAMRFHDSMIAVMLESGEPSEVLKTFDSVNLFEEEGFAKLIRILQSKANELSYVMPVGPPSAS